MICNLCPKACGAQRNEIEGSGCCGLGTKFKIAHYGLFMYEEPCISLNKGSGTIFFCGCNLKCVFCQNHEISAELRGKFISEDEFISIIKKLEDMGAENINLVSPMHYAMQIVTALKKYKPKVPVIYNTNAYENPSVIEFVSPYVDIFLPDFKYYDNNLAQRFSGVDDYYNTALKSIKKMRELKKDKFDENGKMIEGVIIRHMILPLCTNDSIVVLNTIKNEIPDTLVSLMAQYTPLHLSDKYKEINRQITKREYDKVLDSYLELGLCGYVQELKSAGKCYVPKFKYI